MRDIGRCIYCGSQKPPLTREHVLPRGLGGNTAPTAATNAMVLNRASCETCREVTRQFEEDCLIHMLGPARARLKMNRKDRAKPTRRAAIVYRDGREETRDLPIDYIPAAMVIPSFPPAALIVGAGWKPDAIEVRQIVFSDVARLRDPHVRQVSIEMPLKLLSFARMLSKIALGVAHYTFRSGAFDPVACEFIRQGRDHPNHYVGGYAKMSGAPEASNVLHAISLWHHGSYLVATIQLFAEAQGPVNYAVVGRLKVLPHDLPALPVGRVAPTSSGHESSLDEDPAIRWQVISE